MTLYYIRDTGDRVQVAESESERELVQNKLDYIREHDLQVVDVRFTETIWGHVEGAGRFEIEADG